MFTLFVVPVFYSLIASEHRSDEVVKTASGDLGRRTGIDYGREIDLQLQGKWHHVTGLIKYASYDANAFATDTSRFWVQLEYVL